MLKIGQEGQVKFYYYEGKISSKLPVFYNPIMIVNRDLTNLFLNEFKVKKAVSLMSGTGVRELRWKKELNIKEVFANDLNSKAVELIKRNAELNGIKEGFFITQKDARFYDELTEFIDVDPFGSPLPFLQPIIKAKYIKITATDLAVFCTYKNKSILKYRDFARKKEFCHLEAIKILIKRVRDFLRMHELSAEPIFSYYYQHHITIFLKKTKKWRKTGFKIYDYEFLNNLDIIKYEQLLNEKRILASKNSLKLIKLIKGEAFNGFYYYLPKIYSKHRIKPLSIDLIIEKSNEIGIKTTRAHFDSEMVKSEMPYKEFVKFLKDVEKSVI